jgi:flagellar biosynthetic protein FliR
VEPLAQLLSDTTQGFWALAAVFLRTSGIAALLPAFGERTVPMRVKLGLAIGFALIVAPAVGPVDADLTGAAFLAELLIGLAFGLAVRLFVLCLQTAGSIAAQSTSLAQILGGAAVEPIPALGYILVVGGLALATLSGLHVKAAEVMIGSYLIFPQGQFPDPAMLSEWGIGRVVSAFSLAFTLAAPFVITSVVYNLTLGVINRAMPQLMVAFVGAPVITFGAVFLLFLSAPLILSVWTAELIAFLTNPLVPVE